MSDDTVINDEGFDARAADKPVTDNPYPQGSREHKVWRRGWFRADDSLHDLGEQ